jgi:hypothetical protein
VSWTGVPAGSYVLTAVATDDRGTTTTSAARTITVAANAAPMVSLTSPDAGATYTMPASVVLSATASDTDGSVTKVEFYTGTTLVGPDTTSPYSVSWPGVPEGSHSIIAVAYDNQGGMTVSGTREILVTGSQLPTTALFTPASMHDTVDRYVLEIFVAGADPSVSQPVATLDLGRPAVVDNECTVDVRSAIFALAPGSYIAVVSAFSADGTYSSDASPTFIR